jgi:hypothetical protein
MKRSGFELPPQQVANFVPIGPRKRPVGGYISHTSRAEGKTGSISAITLKKALESPEKP